MARNQAIVIGINQYEFLQPLDYAKRDALLGNVPDEWKLIKSTTQTQKD
ncbi:MAG: hypothetical protein RLZZ511_2 [Cyanobacteriota bacterium]|jgi:hypothetical protein